ncbi:unnamed protein product [Onchocerca flexuosa]|uniref:Secreted protein n=1 Tax=Onchocerca flexuosa TaxID=387005 RepID=A0A183H898_9BILA|nr:unnamed protein product [Onchocerca flexuosa]
MSKGMTGLLAAYHITFCFFSAPFVLGNMAKKAFTAVIVTKIPSNSNSDEFEKVDSVIKSAVSPLQVIVSSGNQQQHPIPEATINFITGYVQLIFKMHSVMYN